MTHNISVYSDPTGTAFDPRDQDLYVNCAGDSPNGSTRMVSGIDVLSALNNSLVATILINGTLAAEAPLEPSNQSPPPSSQPPPPPPPLWQGIVYDDSNGNVYAASWVSQNVSVINDSTNTVVDTIPVAGVPIGLAYDGNNGDIYVTTYTVPYQSPTFNNISVISGNNNTVIGNFSVPGVPTSLQFDPVNNDLYVSNVYLENLSIVNAVTHQLVRTLAVNASGGIGYDPVTEEVFVGGEDSNNTGMLTVINGSSNTVSHVLWLSQSIPQGVAYDSRDQNMLVGLATNSTDSLLVVSPQSYIERGSIQVTGIPVGITYNPGNDAAYLAIGGTHNVTVVNPNLPPHLSSVQVSPGSASVETSAVSTFTAIPWCASGACPSGIVYSWSLNNSLGILSPALGNTSHFFAGNRPGEVTVEVAASFDGVKVSDWAHITILNSPTGPSPKGSGYSPILPGLLTGVGLLLAAAALVVVALLIVVIARKRRSSRPSKLFKGQKGKVPSVSVRTEKKGRD